MSSLEHRVAARNLRDMVAVHSMAPGRRPRFDGWRAGLGPRRTGASGARARGGRIWVGPVLVGSGPPAGAGPPAAPSGPQGGRGGRQPIPTAHVASGLFFELVGVEAASASAPSPLRAGPRPPGERNFLGTPARHTPRPFVNAFFQRSACPARYSWACAPERAVCVPQGRLALPVAGDTGAPPPPPLPPKRPTPPPLTHPARTVAKGGCLATPPFPSSNPRPPPARPPEHPSAPGPDTCPGTGPHRDFIPTARWVTDPSIMCSRAETGGARKF